MMKMENEKLNILPVPTYSWLGVNDTHRDSAEKSTAVTVISGDSTSIDVAQTSSFSITAEQGENIFAAMFVRPQQSARLDVKISAHDSSVVRLVQVFEGSAQTVSGVEAQLSDSADFELIQLFLHTSDAVSETKVSLDGRRSSFWSDIGYLLGGEDKLDINLVAEHKGRKTSSEITVKGVLDESSEKVFKGTIDFRNGSVGAFGSENEDVLLIGDKAVNKTVPLILCAEEDVQGSHGASIGRVDEEHIFYMQSRGIPEDKITELMAQSQIAQEVSRIGNDEVTARIYSMIGRGNEDE